MKSRRKYTAYYEDAAMVEAAAIERGFTGKEGESWHDYVDAENAKFRTSREFSNITLAVKWLKGHIAESHSCYGVGTVLLEERMSKRCASCTCGGLRAVREYSVDETGIVERNDLNVPCDDA